MSRSNGNEVGPVAIHRWFADGEGWAYHPWYESQKHELLATLKDTLDCRGNPESSDSRRTFSYKAMGGILFGEQIRDLTCPDVEAAGRFPTILRAVFLRSEPLQKDKDLIAKRLARLQAERPGPDSKLKIELDEPGPAGRRFRVRRGWLLLLLSCVLVVGLFVWLQIFENRNGPAENELRKAEARMSKLLQQWQVNGFGQSDGEDRQSVYKVAQQFLRFLSQEELVGKLFGNHPDVRFASRLPKQGARPLRPEELRSDLESLLADLKQGAGPTSPDKPLMKQKSLTSIVDEVAQQMDYSRWWAATGCCPDYAVLEEADPEVSKFACRFILEKHVDHASTAWQVPAAERMIEALGGLWKVKAISSSDAVKRPWFVYHCFFQLLSRHHFQPEDLREDGWHVEFIKRLPETPLTKDGHFANEQELIDRLRDLARHLNAGESNITSTLVTNIVKSMDYAEWKKGAEHFISREREKGSTKVEEFVKRFCSNQSNH